MLIFNLIYPVEVFIEIAIGFDFELLGIVPKLLVHKGNLFAIVHSHQYLDQDFRLLEPILLIGVLNLRELVLRVLLVHLLDEVVEYA